MTNRPKIGLALSGAAGRAMAHAGVLDVFHEQGVPVDYIAACSSGTIIAAAYACGTLRELKTDFIDKLNRFEMLNWFSAANNSSGLFSLSKAKEIINEKYTKGLKFEQVKPQLGFVTVDIKSGEQVVISMGEIVNGIAAACSIPGLIEPAHWGNKVLIDGGLVNIVPADVVRQMGADIVISVDISASRYLFSESELNVLKGVGWLFRSVGLPISFARKCVNFLRRWLPIGNFMQIYSQSDFLSKADESADLLKIMSKVAEITLRLKSQTDTQSFITHSDIIIEPKVKHWGRTKFDGLRAAYIEGRKATVAVIPQLIDLIHDFQSGKKQKKVIQSPLPLSSRSYS